MAGSALFASGELNVLIVRHGESVNNPLMAEIFAPVVNEAPESPARMAAESRWLRQRLTDPSLTERGLAEAAQFAQFHAPLLAKSVSPGGALQIFVSPFHRTLQTAAPLAAALGDRCRVKVQPDLFEVGGVYTESQGGRGGPGSCLSPEQIEMMFPGFDTAGLVAGPRREGWYRGGWETDSEARARAATLASWLRSAALRKDCMSGTAGASWIVLVIHGHLIDLLMKALLGIADDPARDRPLTNSMIDRETVFFTPNTATAHLSIRQDGSVAIHHLGGTQHLKSASKL
eukprot:TRINITY_DN48983_c0_g1_i1.p1 TRINITY_DN48983_c0_g1~~TRINITY_DN48983_c0_g1_i1.p1  ORF type:complete len:295 (-),score=54.93 TRINITY_DN48983_c0_g1_i1:9-872(-)